MALFLAMKPSFTDKTLCKILTKEYLSNLRVSNVENIIYLKDCQIKVDINLAHLEICLTFLLNTEAKNFMYDEVGKVFYKISESKEEESGVLIFRKNTIINFRYNHSKNKNIRENYPLNFTNHSLFIEILEENDFFKEWLVWNIL